MGDGEQSQALGRVHCDLQDMEQQHQQLQEELEQEEKQQNQRVEKSTEQQTQEAESTQSKQQTPEAESTQSKQQTPEAESTQSKQQTPEAESTQSKQQTPEAESTQSKQQTPEAESTQSKQQTSEAESTQSKQQTPEAESTQSKQQTPEAESTQSKQQTPEDESTQSKILQTDCEPAQQQPEQTGKDYHPLGPQESLNEFQDTQSRKLENQHALESSLNQKQEVPGSRLREDRCQVEQQLRQECLQAQEERLQTQQKLDAIVGELRQKDLKLKELEVSLLQKQAKLETSTQESEEKQQKMDEELTHTQRNLIFKTMQHVEVLAQLKRCEKHEGRTQGLLEERQNSCAEMQQQICALKQEADRLKELVNILSKHRDSFYRSEKEIKKQNHLLTAALERLKDDAFGETETGTPVKVKQLLFEETAEKAVLEEQLQNLSEENEMLDSTIRSLTTKYQNAVTDLEVDLAAEKDKYSQMLSIFSTAEAECWKLKEKLDKTLLFHRDHIQSLNVFHDQILTLSIENQNTQEEDENLETPNWELKATTKELKAEQLTFQKILEETRTHMKQQELLYKQLKISNEALTNHLGHLKEMIFTERAEIDKQWKSLEEDKQRMMDKYKDDLHNVHQALASDRQTTDTQINQLNLKVERVQKFNSQLKEELKTLWKDKEKLTGDSPTEMAAIQVKLRTTEIQVTEAKNQLDELRQTLRHSQGGVTRLRSLATEAEQTLVKKDSEIKLLQSKLGDYELQETVDKDVLQTLRSEKEALEEYADRISRQLSLMEVDMKSRLQFVENAALENRKEYERILHEVSGKIQGTEEGQQQSAESEDWRCKYQELLARVEPYMEQLNASAADRDLLVGRGEMAEAEMAKMADKHGELQGRRKQKIQNMDILTDEYMRCWEEKEALKEKSHKQQNTIQRLERKILTLEGRKTFDPSRAFKHTARREAAAKTDLKTQ